MKSRMDTWRETLTSSAHDEMMGGVEAKSPTINPGDTVSFPLNVQGTLHTMTGVLSRWEHDGGGIPIPVVTVPAERVSALRSAIMKTASEWAVPRSIAKGQTEHRPWWGALVKVTPLMDNPTVKVAADEWDHPEAWSGAQDAHFRLDENGRPMYQPAQQVIPVGTMVRLKDDIPLDEDSHVTVPFLEQFRRNVGERTFEVVSSSFDGQFTRLVLRDLQTGHEMQMMRSDFFEPIEGAPDQMPQTTEDWKQVPDSPAQQETLVRNASTPEFEESWTGVESYPQWREKGAQMFKPGQVWVWHNPNNGHLAYRMKVTTVDVERDMAAIELEFTSGVPSETKWMRLGELAHQAEGGLTLEAPDAIPFRADDWTDAQPGEAETMVRNAHLDPDDTTTFLIAADYDGDLRHELDQEVRSGHWDAERLKEIAERHADAQGNVGGVHLDMIDWDNVGMHYEEQELLEDDQPVSMPNAVPQDWHAMDSDTPQQSEGLVRGAGVMPNYWNGGGGTGSDDQSGDGATHMLLQNMMDKVNKGTEPEAALWEEMQGLQITTSPPMIGEDMEQWLSDALDKAAISWGGDEAKIEKAKRIWTNAWRGVQMMVNGGGRDDISNSPFDSVHHDPSFADTWQLKPTPKNHGPRHQGSEGWQEADSER